MKPTVTFKDGKFYIRNLNDFIPQTLRFTEAWYPTVCDQYARRGQTNERAIKGQRNQATLSEFAVRILLEQLGFKCTKDVDLKIYQNKDKRYDSDLAFDSKFTVNVKTQTRETFKAGKPRSWVLQWNGRGDGHRDPVFTGKSESKFFAFCGVDEDENGNPFVIVFGLPRSKTIIDNAEKFLDLPIAAHLQESKRVVMYDRIKDVGDGDLWEMLEFSKPNDIVKWK